MCGYQSATQESQTEMRTTLSFRWVRVQTITRMEQNYKCYNLKPVEIELIFEMRMFRDICCKLCSVVLTQRACFEVVVSGADTLLPHTQHLTYHQAGRL